MNLLFALMFCFCLASQVFSGPLAQKSCGKRTIKKPQPRIIGGRNALKGEFPWQVSIGGYCGGTILSSKTILTAGHCVSGSKTANVYYNEKNNKTVSKKIIVHPKFFVNREYADYDIAILHVEPPLDLTLENVNSVCLPKNGDDPAEHTNLVVSGWGITDNEFSTKNLMAVDIPAVNRSHCIKQLKDFIKKYNQTEKSEVNERMFCAGIEEGTKGICNGDSGGPIVSFDKNDVATIRGIVSWFFGTAGKCIHPHTSSVFTRIGYFVDNFIKDNFI